MSVMLPNYVLLLTVICLVVWTTAGVWLCQLIRDERKRRDAYYKARTKPNKDESDWWKGSNGNES